MNYIGYDREDTSAREEQERQDKLNEKHMAFIVEKSRKWAAALGLGDWEILFNFVLTIEDDATFPTVMQVETSWGMRQCVISVALDECLARSEENIECDVLHELLHVTVNEMRWDVSHAPAKLPGCSCDHQHEERVVTTLTKAIWNMEQKYLDIVQFHNAITQQALEEDKILT